jgi:hypothetical protein
MGAMLAFDEGWAGVVFVRLGDRIDRKSRAVGGRIRSDVSSVNIVVLDQVRGKACLIDVNGDVVGGQRPLKVSSEEPIHGPHELYRDKVREELLESAFDLGVLREVYKVVDIDAKSKRGQGWLDCGVGWVEEVSGEKARVGCVVFEAKTEEDALYLCVPVAGAAAEAIQCAFKKPIFIFLGAGVANGWLDNCYLIRRKNALAEGVFAVALFEGASALDGHADQETQHVRPKDGGVLLRFCPNAVFVVTKENYAGLGT